MARTPAEIRAALLAEVDRAGHRYQQASDTLKQFISDIPSGIPHPDSARRIAKAGEEQRAALEALREALNRWNEFTIHETTRNNI